MSDLCLEPWLPALVLQEGWFDLVREDHIPCKIVSVCVSTIQGAWETLQVRDFLPNTCFPT